MGKYCVYKHTTPSGKVYIGITRRKPEKRFEGGKGYRGCTHFMNAIQKYGWDNITHEIIETGLTKEQAEEKERYYIKFYDSTNPKLGYNIAYGGGVGDRFTEETKRKISESLKKVYQNPEMREALRVRSTGHKHSEETKAKMSAARKGRKMPREVVEKIAALNRGKHRAGHPQSAETRNKISQKNKGIHRGGIGRTPRPVICVETGIVYKSVKAAANELGVSGASIYDVCNGKRNSLFGFTWRYANEYKALTEKSV